MKLVIGLGNPEERYAKTRHNVGFYMLDAYARSQGASWQVKDKFKALVSETQVGSEKVLLVKPTTYYNNVGEAGRLIADFYKIPPEDILIVHDELALPFGVIRTRLGGSPAGNNGIKSINQHIGPDTARIRIGVYNELRDRINDADFVLSNFTKDEDAALSSELENRAIRLIEDFISDKFEASTHK